jgi:hypothetical protein
MELVRVASGDYSSYEELLLRRDELEKEAELILLEYIRIFGDITTEIFKLKVECIALKKSISYCIMMKNRGENVDPDKLAEYIAEKMAAYQEELEEMIKKNEEAKKGEKISAYQAKEIKRIYRKLAKILHPDISNVIEKHPELGMLFQRIMIAYQCNDYKELKELEVLTNKALDDLGEEKFEVVIPDIETKIEELEEEIRSIKTSEPYTLRELLEDTVQKEQKMKDFEDEKETYSKYKEELGRNLKELQEN